jgi:hypothetical protein
MSKMKRNERSKIAMIPEATTQVSVFEQAVTLRLLGYNF